MVAGWALSYLKSEHEEWHRDGSSGGVIRTVNINKSGAERKFVPGNKLPYGPL